MHPTYSCWVAHNLPLLGCTQPTPVGFTQPTPVRLHTTYSLLGCTQPTLCWVWYIIPIY
ncbi:hypothetical protein SPLC1_S102830 [Arthrospira platensis C1]|nr:hypothetical protein SPLC1_S102830 [Arthrospira platensis C1]